MDIENFVKNYINAWATTDPNQRKQLIELIYSDSVEFFANEPGDKPIMLKGLDNINNNITQVNERLVIGNKLITELTGYSENHNTLRVTWQMKKPDGNIALNGMNFLQLDNSEKILRDYIFIN